ncbi:MAG: 2-amino-4-hydroxy-6-hydroxymethyldihydropteridine diphosphokinase [Longimicrobiales bacterium]
MAANQESAALIYIALGSNLGDRGRHLRAALAALRRLLTIEAVSRVYQTEPVGIRDQPDFWNLVLRAHTTLEPLALIRELQAIEQALGRTSTVRNAPRTIDIDLLSYDALELHTNELVVPHPRLHERTFVLYPLAEIAPDFYHAGLRQSVHELIAGLPERTRAIPLAENVLEERA